MEHTSKRRYKHVNLYMTVAENDAMWDVIRSRRNIVGTKAATTPNGFLVERIALAIRDQRSVIIGLLETEREISRRDIPRTMSISIAFPSIVKQAIEALAESTQSKVATTVYAAFRVGMGKVPTVHPTLAMIEHRAIEIWQRLRESRYKEEDERLAADLRRQLSAAKFEISPAYRLPGLDHVERFASAIGMDPWEALNALGYYAFKNMNKLTQQAAQLPLQEDGLDDDQEEWTEL